MKITFFYVLIFGVLLFFSSCQKEITGELPPVTIPTSEGSILDKYVGFDTTEANGLDTISVYQFHYDNQKRLSKITSRWYDAGTTHINATSDARRFYNSNDTVPYMLVMNTVANGISYTDTLFLNYDTDNMITRDSIRRYQGNTLRDYYCFHYSKINSWNYLVYGSAYDFILAMPIPTNTIAVSKNAVSGNFISSYDSIYGQPSPTDYRVVKHTYTYDNHPNPFIVSALRYPDHTYAIDSGNEFDLYTKNNPIGYQEEQYSSYASPFSKTIEIRYTYNSQGYPTSIDQYQNGMPNFPNYFKLKLFYKNP